MAGKEDPVRNYGAVAGGRTPTKEEELRADCESGGLRPPCAGGHMLADEEEAGAGGKRKATDADMEAAGHSSASGEAAADATSDAAASRDVDDDDEEEWVEMPEDYLRWILSQTRETDPVPSLDGYSLSRRADPQESARLLQRIDRFRSLQDEFFEFQAWVHETFKKNGCVMVPPNFAGPQGQLQEEMNDLWGKLMKEYDDAESAAKEDTLVALPAN